MMKRFLPLILLTCAIAIYGCAEDSPTDASNNGSNTANNSGQPMPSFASASAENWGGTMASIQFSFTQTGLPISFDMNMGFAQFGQTGADAGDMTINDEAISKTSSGAGIFYNSFNQTSPNSLASLQFNGSDHIFSISGAAAVPAMELRVRSPLSFELTAPVADAAVQKSSGLALTWTGGSASSNDSILVAISPSQQNQFAYARQGIANTGSYTIPAADLAPYSGVVTLHVVKYNWKSTTKGGKDYYAVSEIVKQQSITLQ